MCLLITRSHKVFAKTRSNTNSWITCSDTQNIIVFICIFLIMSAVVQLINVSVTFIFPLLNEMHYLRTSKLLKYGSRVVFLTSIFFLSFMKIIPSLYGRCNFYTVQFTTNFIYLFITYLSFIDPTLKNFPLHYYIQVSIPLSSEALLQFSILWFKSQSWLPFVWPEQGENN
jgi:hypothetical protein